MHSVWIRLEWTGIYRISCELATPRKISCLTHQIIVFAKPNVLLAPMVKIVILDSSPSCAAAKKLTGMAVSPWGGRMLRICDSLTLCLGLLTRVHPSYKYSLPQQGVHSLQILRDLWEFTGFLCPAEESGDNSLLRRLKLYLISSQCMAKSMSSSRGSSGFCP